MTSYLYLGGGIASLLIASFWLLRSWPRRPRPYDPAWIVRAAKEQRPNDEGLHAALERCTIALSIEPFYIGFVDARRPNRPGSHWQFARNIHLESTEQGDVVLDILKSGEVGGVELQSRLLEAD